MGRILNALIGPSEREIRAAAAKPHLTPSVALPPNGWGTGFARLAPASMTFAPPVGIWNRWTAMQNPTVARARDLLCAAIGTLPLCLYRIDYTDPENPVEQRLQPAAWMVRPDPDRTRAHLLAWTADDLIFYGRAYWRVVERYATGYPSRFRRMATERVSVKTSGDVTFREEQIDPADVVEFLSLNDGVLFTGWRAIDTAMKLDAAACRFAANNVPQGWLKQTGGEPLGGGDLVELAAGWDAQREANATGALNADVDYHESTYDPQRLQLIESRQHQSLELARVMDVPATLVHAPTGARSTTYQNSVQGKADLIDFGAQPLISCIEQTLSGPNVTPLGQQVRLDLDAYLRNPYVPGSPTQPPGSPQSDETGPGGGVGADVSPLTPPAQVTNGRPRQADGRNAAP